MFTTFTKSPRNQNYKHNVTNAPDNITRLALAQRWPASARDSLLERVLLQGQRVRSAVAAHPDFALIQSRRDLESLLARRALGETALGAVLGAKGAHALVGELENIERLYAVGFRMIGLQHFFDNRRGGSLHAESQSGLTDFRKRAVRTIRLRGILIDVAHSS